MRRLLIVGCGDVVRRALPELVRRWRVYALVREPEEDLRALGVLQIPGDLDRPATLRRLAGIAHAVLHSAPPPGDGAADTRTQRLIAALGRSRSLPRSLVYISTSGVYGDCGGALVDESRPSRPETARARRRVDAERRLRAFGRRSACRVSVLRAPGIYAGDRLPLDRIERGDPVLHSDEDVFTNHIHADDLGRACIAALRRGRPNRAYHASDDSALRMGDWYDKLADRFALARLPRVTRAEAARRLSPVMLSFMGESRRLDNTRLKRELKMALRYPTVDAGLASIRENR
ncbi:MAG TPA: NAD-dependent epimerase/dehydratase family protein [Rhodocyclaceae bacterium]